MGASLSILYGIPIGLCMAFMCAVPLSRGSNDYKDCLLGSVLGISFLGIVYGFVVEARVTAISLICAIVVFCPLLILFKYLRRVRERARLRSQKKYKEIWNFLNDLDGSKKYCQYFDDIRRNFQTVDDLKSDEFRTKALLNTKRMKKGHLWIIMDELFEVTPRRDAVFGYIRKFGMKIPDELALICLEYYGKKMEFTVGSYCYCDNSTNYVVVTEVLGNETFRILDLFEESECPSKVVCGHNLSLIKDDSKLRIAKQQHKDYQASMYAEIQRIF